LDAEIHLGGMLGNHITSPSVAVDKTVTRRRESFDTFAGAVATIAPFTNDNLFLDQSPLFFETVGELAVAADAALREF
jgi:hypothetical protein